MVVVDPMGLKMGGSVWWRGGHWFLEEGDLPIGNNRPPGGQMMKSLWFVVPQNKGGFFKGLVGREEGGRGEERQNLSDFFLSCS